MSADGGKMQKIATVEGDSLSYADTSAEAGKTYRYRIRSNDQGPRSGSTSIDVPELEPDPTPPFNDRVVRVEPTFNNTDSSDHDQCGGKHRVRRHEHRGAPTRPRTADMRRHA